MKRKLVFCLLLIYSGTLLSQQVHQPKATLMATLNAPIGVLQVEDPRFAPMLGMSLSFEPKTKSENLRFNASIGFLFGAYYNSDQSPPGTTYIGGKIVYLTNPVGNTFDFSAGLAISVSQSADVKFYPKDKWHYLFGRIDIGYRFYLGEVFFIKPGLGYPSLANISFGTTF